MEHRRLRVSAELAAYLASNSRWHYLAPVGELTHTVTTDSIIFEGLYLVTTLVPQRTCPCCLLR